MKFKIIFMACIIFLQEVLLYNSELTNLFDFSLICRPEKMAKLPVILGNLDITIDNVSSDFPSKCTFCVINRPAFVWFLLQFVCFYFFIFFQIMSTHHTFLQSNLKPVLKCRLRLRWRNLYPASLNTLNLTPSTTITFMFILSP